VKFKMLRYCQEVSLQTCKQNLEKLKDLRLKKFLLIQETRFHKKNWKEVQNIIESKLKQLPNKNYLMLIKNLIFRNKKEESMSNILTFKSKDKKLKTYKKSDRLKWLMNMNKNNKKLRQEERFMSNIRN